MELGSEIRKKAVAAFKEELLSLIAALRANLSESPLNWKGLEHRVMLHRIKGGAGFLGYKELTLLIAELEGIALRYPEDPQRWFEVLIICEQASFELV